MAYRVTMHGEPVYPSFIFKVKWRLERFLQEEKHEEYTIKKVDLDVPKFGLSHNELLRQNVLKDDIKNVSITFKGKDGVLNSFSGNEAIDIIKNLKEDQ